MYSPVPLSRTPYIMQRQRKVNKTKARVPRPSNLRGKGDYTDDIKNILKPLPRLEAKIDHLERALAPKVSSAASTLGRTLGSLVGQGELGSIAGSTLAKMFGHGDYTVKTNTLMNSLSGPTLPKFSSNNRGTRIVEREFLGDVFSGPVLASGSTTFDRKSYSLNPTDSSTFPWLSKIANQFDQWEPHGIVFEFVSTSSEYNGLAQSLGAVVMATDYDPYDPAFAEKVEMENSDYACSTKPSCNLIHGIECDPTERPTKILYTQSSNPSMPLTSITLGNFQIATQGLSNTGVTLGELWVSYDITFYKKQLTEEAVTLPFIAYSFQPTASVGWLTGTYITGPTSKTITVTVVVGTGSRINFNNTQVGSHYEVVLINAGSDTLDGNLMSWSGAGLSFIRVTAIQPGTSGIAVQTMVRYHVVTTAPFATLTTNLRGSLTGQVNPVSTFSVTQLNPSQLV
nr:MAG: capsid protein [Chemarfal virus 149]